MELTAVGPVLAAFALKSILISVLMTPIASTVFASAGHYTPKQKPAPTTPSGVYSGASAIDISNGGVYSNGTFGQPNVAYEKWAKSPTWAVGLSDMTYTFDQKEKFTTTLNERIEHFELAVWNYSQVTAVSKPEGLAHAQKMIADLAPKIDRAREAWAKAKSAGRSDWESASNEAKKAFLDLQSFSYGIHKNVSSSR